jgi:hypothetical protein
MFILKLRLLMSFEGNTLATSSGVVNFAVPLEGAAPEEVFLHHVLAD